VQQPAAPNFCGFSAFYAPRGRQYNYADQVEIWHLMCTPRTPIKVFGACCRFCSGWRCLFFYLTNKPLQTVKKRFRLFSWSKEVLGSVVFYFYHCLFVNHRHHHHDNLLWRQSTGAQQRRTTILQYSLHIREQVSLNFQLATEIIVRISVPDASRRWVPRRRAPALLQ